MTTENEIKPAAPAEGLDGGRCAVDAGFGVPPEVAALARKARLAQAAQRTCWHDWEEDRPSQLETVDPHVFGNMLPPSPRFNGSSVCRICGERRATSLLDGFTRFQSLSPNVRDLQRAGTEKSNA